MKFCFFSFFFSRVFDNRKIFVFSLSTARRNCGLEGADFGIDVALGSDEVHYMIIIDENSFSKISKGVIVVLR